MCCTAYVASAITKQTSSTSWPWNSRSTSGVNAARSSVTTISAPVSTEPANAAFLTTGPPPMPRLRRSATARPTSCSSGRKNPGATTNTKIHSPLSAAYSGLSSALNARIWKPYAVRPEIMSPRPTA